MLSKPPVICVVDTGISDENIAARHVIDGVNFSGQGAADDWRDPDAKHADALCQTVIANHAGAPLAIVRVLDRNGTLRDMTALDRAFAWILAHRERLGIAAVLIALADLTHNMSDEAYANTAFREAVVALRAQGVLTVVPAGNWAETRPGPGLPWPAILNETISVGALDPDTGTAARYSQWLYPDMGRRSAPTLLARPGLPDRTSGAAATVTGRLAALMARDPDAGCEAVLAALLANTLHVAGPDGGTWPALPS